MSNEFEESYDEPAAPAAEPAAEQAQPRQGGGGVTIQTPWLVTGIVILIAIVLVVYFAAIRNTNSPQKTATGPTSTTPAQSVGRYTVRYPKSWAPVSPTSVAPGEHAFAAFRQKNGQGVVVMRLQGKINKIDPAYLAALKAQLKNSLPDYKFVGSHVIDLQNGKALDVTYDRTSLGQVRNVVVLPTANASVVIATIAPKGSTSITREINEIVSSFKLSS